MRQRTHVARADEQRREPRPRGGIRRREGEIAAGRARQRRIVCGERAGKRDQQHVVDAERTRPTVLHRSSPCPRRDRRRGRTAFNGSRWSAHRSATPLSAHGAADADRSHRPPASCQSHSTVPVSTASGSSIGTGHTPLEAKAEPSRGAPCPARRNRVSAEARTARRVFDSSAYRPGARPEERPLRELSSASRLRRALCAVPQRFGARLHAAHRLRSRDGRGNGAGCRFTDATFRSGRTPPVPAWGKSPCARNGRRCLRCRVSRTAEAAVVPTLDHPAFVSGHAPIAASRLPDARRASYHVCNVPSCRRDGRSRRTTRPPDAERLV